MPAFKTVPTKVSFYRQAADWAEDYLLQSLILAGQLGMAWAGSPVFPANRPRFQSWTFWSSAIVAVACSVVLLLRTARMTRITDERDELHKRFELTRQSYSSIFERHLEHISRGLGLTERERITIYSHKNGKFIPLARYSENAAFRERGRVEYPMDQGCIAEAWLHGSEYEPSLPHPKHSPDSYLREQQNRWKVPEDTTKHFKMKSRCLAAFRIDGDRRLAVIVFESITANGLQKSELERIMKIEGRHIADLMKALAPFEPDPMVAKTEGF